jgi:hypothetical protein
MRKLSRQATIFALLGFLLTFISFFAILGANITTNAMADATAAVHAEIDPPGIHLPLGSRARPIDTVDVPPSPFAGVSWVESGFGFCIASYILASEDKM